MPTVIIHMLNEDPVLGEIDDLPTMSDTLMLVRSPRRKDGKRPAIFRSKCHFCNIPN